MRGKTVTYVRLLILGWFIPIVLSFVVYFGFQTNYTIDTFSLDGFTEQYNSGIYRYRVIGNNLLLHTYDLVKDNNLPTIHVENGDAQFYTAYFYLNTVFLCLTCTTMFMLLGGLKKNDFFTVDLPLLSLTGLMTLTQYVVVPYDTLSYFFLSAAAWLILQKNEKRWAVFALAFIVVLATLTRETASLILAFYFAVNFAGILKKPAKFTINPQQRDLIILTLCFIGTYVGLRVFYGTEQAIFQNIIPSNLALPGLLSILFFISIVFLLLTTKSSPREMLVFLLASLPYIIPLFFISVLWEIRLWVPILLLMLLLKIRGAQELLSINANTN